MSLLRRIVTACRMGLLLVLLVALSAEARAKGPQDSPVAAPDGRHVARVDILPKPCLKGFSECWVVSIHKASGGEVFRDDRGFPAFFNVYWEWDAQGRLWLYNSDDGAMFIYEVRSGSWARREASDGERKATPPKMGAYLARFKSP